MKPGTPSSPSDLDRFVERVIQEIHERYDALREVVRRRGQDARDAQDEQRRREAHE